MLVIIDLLRQRLHNLGAFRSQLRNILYSSGDHVILLLLWVVTTPIFLRSLGSELFGIWMIGNAFVASSVIFGLGIRDATIRLVAARMAQDDRSAVVRLLRTAIMLHVVLGVLVAAAMYVLSPFLASDLFTISAPNQDAGTNAFRLTGLVILLLFVDQIGEAGLHGFERFDLTARINMLARSSGMLVSIGLVVSGYGLNAVFLTLIGTYCVQAALKAQLLSRRFLPELKWKPLLNLQEVRVLWNTGLPLWYQLVATAIGGQSDRFIIASLLDTSSAGVYSVCMQVGQQVQTLLLRAMAFILPVASALYEKGNLSELRRHYRYGLQLSAVVIAGASLPLLTLAPEVLQLWISESFANQGAQVLRLVVVAFTFSSLGVISVYMLMGTGFAHWLTVANLLSGAIVVTLSLMLIPSSGLEGAGWARVATAPTLILLFSIAHLRVMRDRSMYSFTLSTFLVLIIAAAVWLLNPIATALGSGIGSLILAASMLSLIGMAIASLLIAGLHPFSIQR